MIKNLKILVISIFMLMGFVPNVIAEKNNNDKTEAKNGSFFIHVVKNYPLLTSFAAIGLLSCGLYPKETLNFIEGNRDTILGIGTTTVLLGYLTRKYWLPSFDSDLEDEQSDDDYDKVSNLEIISQSGVRIYYPGDIKETFKDVAGLESAKDDLLDIKQFLENPKIFKAMGAKVPKGILMSGAPGNGKTLLARALAGEVGCPFLYITGTEFTEMLVGVGAARVRDLFEVAKEQAPCIIFIDEIDTIGHKRSSLGASLGHSDSQTLNQLLAEMDGFEQNKTPIIIVGATNRVEVIDEALLRPGRFDRKIEILPPFFKDRCTLLSLYLKKVKASCDIDVARIAMGTIGFSGAELANLINEAAILAVRSKSKFVTMNHIDQARDYILLGRETKGMDITAQEAWVTAVHEAGHALMHVYQTDATSLYKVTITPRGGALGLTFGMQTNEKYSMTDMEMRAHIKVALGGSVAEEIIFGHRGAGASSDLEKVRNIATAMVMSYGMTEEFKDVSFKEFIYNQVHLPDQIATKLHQSVAKVIAECRKDVESILFKHKDILLDLAKKLVDQGTVIGSDVYKMCGVKEPDLVYSLV